MYRTYFKSHYTCGVIYLVVLHVLQGLDLLGKDLSLPVAVSQSGLSV